VWRDGSELVIPTEQVVAGDVVLITCLTHEAITEEHPVRPGIEICFIRTDGGASPEPAATPGDAPATLNW
jgi:hypothetical protein